jgi:hypothetical protein
MSQKSIRGPYRPRSRSLAGARSLVRLAPALVLGRAGSLVTLVLVQSHPIAPLVA